MGSQTSRTIQNDEISEKRPVPFRDLTATHLRAKPEAAHLTRLNITAQADSHFISTHNQHRKPNRMLTSSSASPRAGPAVISLDVFAKWQNTFERDSKALLASTLLSKQHLSTALVSRSVVAADKQVFSETLSLQPTPVTNQKSSGRCWLFATCNVVRLGLVKKFNLGDFELSQSYLFFYDSLEKSNYYLESMIDLAEEPVSSRIVSHLSSTVKGDGGQWDMVVGLIEKYGLVPKSVYDESFNSSNTGALDAFLSSKLRDQALELRAIYSSAKSDALNRLDQNNEAARQIAMKAARDAKEDMMAAVYRILAIALGPPPSATTTFTWEYNDKDRKAHSLTTTPLDFYHLHCSGFKASDYFSLINDPRNDYSKLYTVDRLGSVWGGRAVKYVNTTSQIMKETVVKMIKSDRPVWFGCDVGKLSNSTLGIMDTKLIDYENAFGVAPKMSKAERLQMGDSAMTHAMVITAVHLDSDGRPVRYKVENSWSDTAGDHGYFVMTDSWFDEFVYQIVIPTSVAPSQLRKVFEENEAIALPPWDPMGSLA